ncbi:MAG: hypothetical protein COT17_06250, partial [Elusimicrobia bacterium CG08_land_8_20_14_0_20_51_18]
LGLLRMKNPPSEAQKRDYVARRLAPMTVRQLEVILAYLEFIKKTEEERYSDFRYIDSAKDSVSRALENRRAP